MDGNGQVITYREWGTVPSDGNPMPGGERIVTGSDGSVYFTPDHYKTFIRWQP
jgi:guanyl-specific ribonuclease Sa